MPNTIEITESYLVNVFKEIEEFARSGSPLSFNDVNISAVKICCRIIGGIVLHTQDIMNLCIKTHDLFTSIGFDEASKLSACSSRTVYKGVDLAVSIHRVYKSLNRDLGVVILKDPVSKIEKKIDTDYLTNIVRSIALISHKQLGCSSAPLELELYPCFSITPLIGKRISKKEPPTDELGSIKYRKNVETCIASVNRVRTWVQSMLSVSLTGTDPNMDYSSYQRSSQVRLNVELAINDLIMDTYKLEEGVSTVDSFFDAREKLLDSVFIDSVTNIKPIQDDIQTRSKTFTINGTTKFPSIWITYLDMIIKKYPEVRLRTFMEIVDTVCLMTSTIFTEIYSWVNPIIKYYPHVYKFDEQKHKHVENQYKHQESPYSALVDILPVLDHPLYFFNGYKLVTKNTSASYSKKKPDFHYRNRKNVPFPIFWVIENNASPPPINSINFGSWMIGKLAFFLAIGIDQLLNISHKMINIESTKVIAAFARLSVYLMAEENTRKLFDPFDEKYRKVYEFGSIPMPLESETQVYSMYSKTEKEVIESQMRMYNELQTNFRSPLFGFVSAMISDHMETLQRQNNTEMLSPLIDSFVKKVNGTETNLMNLIAISGSFVSTILTPNKKIKVPRYASINRAQLPHTITSSITSFNLYCTAFSSIDIWLNYMKYSHEHNDEIVDIVLEKKLNESEFKEWVIRLMKLTDPYDQKEVSINENATIFPLTDFVSPICYPTDLFYKMMESTFKELEPILSVLLGYKKSKINAPYTSFIFTQSKPIGKRIFNMSQYKEIESTSKEIKSSISKKLSQSEKEKTEFLHMKHFKSFDNLLKEINGIYVADDSEEAIQGMYKSDFSQPYEVSISDFQILSATDMKAGNPNVNISATAMTMDAIRYVFTGMLNGIKEKHGFTYIPVDNKHKLQFHLARTDGAHETESLIVTSGENFDSNSDNHTLFLTFWKRDTKSRRTSVLLSSNYNGISGTGFSTPPSKDENIYTYEIMKHYTLIVKNNSTGSVLKPTKKLYMDYLFDGPIKTMKGFDKSKHMTGKIFNVPMTKIIIEPRKSNDDKLSPVRFLYSTVLWLMECLSMGWIPTDSVFYSFRDEVEESIASYINEHNVKEVKE